MSSSLIQLPISHCYKCSKWNRKLCVAKGNCSLCRITLLPTQNESVCVCECVLFLLQKKTDGPPLCVRVHGELRLGRNRAGVLVGCCYHGFNTRCQSKSEGPDPARISDSLPGIILTVTLQDLLSRDRESCSRCEFILHSWLVTGGHTLHTVFHLETSQTVRRSPPLWFAVVVSDPSSYLTC